MSRQLRRKIERQLQKLLKRQNKKRSRRHLNTLGFAPLEPRQLLAVLSTPLADGSNLLTNASFETADISTGNQLDPADVPGWSTDTTAGGLINIFNSDRLGNILELDSTAAQVDQVFQDVQTTSGNDYVISFNFRERDAGASADASSNEIQVFWAGEQVGTFTPDADWNLAVINVSADSATSRLEFRENSAGNDGIGGLIDDVRVVEANRVTVPNFSFENTRQFVSSNADLNADEFVSPFPNINGWLATGVDVNSKLIRIRQDGQAAHGDRYLNLETSSDQTDIIFQDIATQADQQYYITFQLRGDASQSDASNELRVRWNNDWAGTFIGGSEWQTYGMLVDSTSDLSRLVFREVASGAGSGPFIDDIRIHQVVTGTNNNTGTIVNDLVVDIDTSASGRNGSASFAETAGAVPIVANGIALSHPSNTTLTYAAVQIENVLDGANEVLAVDVGTTGLRTSYDSATGRLNINGQATVAEYQTVLGSLTYDNTSSTPNNTSRTIAISITDHAIPESNNFSEKSTITLSIEDFNATPQIDAIPDRAVDFGTALSIQVDATDADSTDLTYSLESSGDTGGSTPTISDQGIITWDAALVDGGTANFTVTVTDDEGASSQEEFAITVGSFTPFEGERALSDIDPALRNGIYDTAPAMTIDTSLEYTAVLNTDVGEIRIELFPEEAPLTVNNFVNLVEDGFYDGVTFHRVISGFVAQGGDPLGTGTGGPGYRFADEFVDSLQFNRAGQLAMANSGPATNGSQFFITYGASPGLTEVHTIFGQLSGGEAALNAITLSNSGSPATVIQTVQIVTS